MTFSKFCSLKFFALCCLCFAFTILNPQSANAGCTWQYWGPYATSPDIMDTFDSNCGAVYNSPCMGCTSFPAMASCSEGESCDGVPHPDCLINPGVCTMDYNGYIADTWDRYKCVCAPDDGTCGSADGVAVSSAPSSNLCSAGTPSAVSGSGPWTWACNGSGGGTNASCSAPLAAPLPIDGSCSPTPGVCTTGIISNDTGPVACGDTREWKCNGLDGGNTVDCVHENLCDVNGSCSATPGMCDAGSVSSDNGSISCGTTRTWDCIGYGTGSTANCSFNNVACSSSVNGVCGVVQGISTQTVPSSGLCSAGNETAVSLAANTYSWSCQGISGGSDASCTAPQIVHGQCGPADGTPTATAPGGGLCSAGTTSALSGTGPWTWNCIGINTGSTQSCNAPLAPPPPSFGGACPI